ncbi:MAG: DRTGG domain-containing protein [Bacteroidales bacterium]
MKISKLISELNLKLVAGESGIENDFNGAYVSDLLSDVMGKAQNNQVWITLQTHKNIMAIASLKDLSAIILVQGLKPDADTIEKSNEDGIPILICDLPTFEIAGKIYNMLNS